MDESKSMAMTNSFGDQFLIGSFCRSRSVI